MSLKGVVSPYVLVLIVVASVLSGLITYSFFPRVVTEIQYVDKPVPVYINKTVPVYVEKPVPIYINNTQIVYVNRTFRESYVTSIEANESWHIYNATVLGVNIPITINLTDTVINATSLKFLVAENENITCYVYLTFTGVKNKLYAIIATYGVYFTDYDKNGRPFREGATYLIVAVENYMNDEGKQTITIEIPILQNFTDYYRVTRFCPIDVDVYGPYE